MKKILVIIWLFTIPLYTSARTGWYFKDYSIMYGGSSSLNNKISYNLEISFDKGWRSCTHNPFYYGFSINSTFDKEFKEYGFKSFLNPTRYSFHLSRRLKIIPHAYLQANIKKKEIEAKSSSDYNYKVGLGINSRYFSGNIISVRSTIQVGYVFNDKFISPNKNLVIEFKIGFGLNSNVFKKKKTD